MGISIEIAASDVIPKYSPFSTHRLMTQKAIDLLLEKGKLEKRQIEELKRYKERIILGSEEEDTLRDWWFGEWYWRPDNHAYDPETGLGKKDHASALDWAKEGAYDPGNKKYNDYDWGDARKHYKNGNKSMAYKCLGHVCHLLQDMSVPGHTIPSIKDGENGIKKGIHLYSRSI
jgi:hypothetical protein